MKNPKWQQMDLSKIFFLICGHQLTCYLIINENKKCLFYLENDKKANLLDDTVGVVWYYYQSVM